MGLQCLCQRDITLPCWGDFVRTQLLGPSLAFLSHEVSRGGGGGCCEDLNFYPVQGLLAGPATTLKLDSGAVTKTP